MANRLTTVSYRRSELYYATNFLYDRNGNLLTKKTEYSTVPFLESYRNSFETDTNGDGKPDGWNVAWRNGISTGAYAKVIPYEPIPDGKNALRLYNGTGDAQSYQYIDSDSIPVSADTAYQVQAAMRYTLQQGGRATMAIIQFDVNGVEVSYDFQEYGNGAWSWKEHSFKFRTKPNAATVKIRMYIGGEESAYLDLDSVVLCVRTMGVNRNASFESDANNDGRHDLWESSWRYGSSTGFFARRDSNAPHPDGQYEYRLYNGTGDPHAYEYVLSDHIPVAASASYQIRAWMRYTVSSGGIAEMAVYQYDAAGKEISNQPISFNNGGWTWHEHALPFTTAPQAASIRIRFSIGGEEGAYLDVDQVRFVQ